MTRTSLSCVLFALTAACASAGARDEIASGTKALRAEDPIEASTAETPLGPTQLEPFAQPAGSGEPRGSLEPAPTVEASSPRAVEASLDLDLWNDPDFRRRFTESYIAESETEPRVTETEREEMQAVLELISSGKADEAAKRIKKKRTDASSAVLDFTLANIHFQEDEFELAIAAYQTAVEKFPRFRRAWGNLGLCHARLGQYREASLAFTHVIEQGGGSAAQYGLLGIAYSNLGDPLAAESAFRMASLLDPASRDWKMGLAESLFKQGRFADAVALCATLIEAQPERAELWLLQANAYARLQRPLEAAQNLELVDRLGRSTAESLYLLGDIYTNEELHDMAAQTYLHAMEKGPDANATRAIRAAKGLSLRGAHPEAGRMVEAIEAQWGERLDVKQRQDVLHLRVRLAVAEGSGEAEVRALEEIVALNPLDGEALILLGEYEARAGNAEKAVFYYERAAQLEAFEADAKVRHAQLLVGQGNYAAAAPMLRRAQTLNHREHIQDYLEQVERIAQGR